MSLVCNSLLLYFQATLDMRSLLTTLFALALATASLCQGNVVEIAETMEEYVKENHVEDVENLVHKLAKSRNFLDVLLKNGHNFDPNTVEIKRKDVSVGGDIDIYVKHISEHQTFTMVLLPISFYNLQIYDTILFTSLEVSDEWLQKIFEVDSPDDSLRSVLLAKESHKMLEQHILGQATNLLKLSGMGEVRVELHESYISTNSVSVDVSELDKEEKKSFRKSWGLVKKALTHNVSLNVELNVYVFGVDDMDVTFSSSNRTKKFKANPANVFQRHHFTSSSESP